MLSARVGQAESVLAYAAVADLLGDVDPAVLAELPDVQRLAVDRVLLRASSDGAQPPINVWSRRRLLPSSNDSPSTRPC